MSHFRVMLGLAALLVPAVALAEAGEAGDTTADRVLGQGSFTAGERDAVDAGGLALPPAVAVDTSVVPNRLYVADTENSRVLAWADAAAVAKGAPADLVIGQRDPFASGCNGGPHGTIGPDAGPDTLCRPTAVAVDPAGNLWIADTGNHRVLELDSPFTTDLVADRILGQPSDPRASCGDPAEGFLCSPSGLAVHRTGAIAVADRDNCRILVLVMPLADLKVDRVLGSTVGSFAGCEAECSAGGLCHPTFLATDAPGNLWATTENTVLGFDRPLATDALPDRRLATAGFLCERGAVATRESLCHPAGLALDAGGTLWVADQSSSRVLGFDAPLASDAVADRVLGQGGSFESAACNQGGLSARSLCGPGGLAFDGAGRLWVADSGNNRVLRFNAPRSQQAAARVLGQADFRTGAVNRLDARGFFLPASVAVDRSVSPNRLWVADTENSRVLGWRDAAGFANGAPADLILGQPDLSTSACNSGGLSARSLCRPRGLAVDATGTLWVADLLNHRVLAFESPFATDLTADLVLGQGGSFTSNACFLGGRSASSLCQPRDVAVDARGNVYVADFERVLQFDRPARKGAVADRVFGKPSFQAGGCITTTRSVCDPWEVELDPAGTLWVVDLPNSRILGYHRPLGSDTQPDVVLGQRGSFTTGGCNQGGLGPDTLCFPTGLAATDDGDLYVADRENNRVLLIESPGRGPRITRVFGQQGSFTSNVANLGGITADSLVAPLDVAVDEEGNLYVADSANHRVLVYEKP